MKLITKLLIIIIFFSCNVSMIDNEIAEHWTPGTGHPDIIAQKIMTHNYLKRINPEWNNAYKDIHY